MERRTMGYQQPFTYSAPTTNQLYPAPHQTQQQQQYYGNGGGMMGGGGQAGWGPGTYDNGGGRIGEGGGGMHGGYVGKGSGGVNVSGVNNVGGGGIGGVGVGEIGKVGEKIQLAKTSQEKQSYATMAEFFALIKAMDHLERAWYRDSVSSEEYEKNCWTLIQKFRSLRATADGVIPDMDRFIEEYKIQAPKGHYRLLKAGMPATVEVSGRDNRNDREQMKHAAQCTQNFITLMDSLQLNVKTVEALLPGSIALIETLDKVDAVPADFAFKEKLRRWVQKMNGMRAVDELSAEDGLPGMTETPSKRKMDASKPYTYSADIPFSSARLASIAQQALSVDPELRPDLVERSLAASGETLQIHLSAQDPKSLRVAVSSLLDFLQVCVRTIQMFANEDNISR